MQAMFSVGPLRGRMTRLTDLVQRMSAVQLMVQLWSVNQRATEAEESPLLRFVTKKRLGKALRFNSHCGELLPRKDQ
jgi:hypothetical protein